MALPTIAKRIATMDVRRLKPASKVADAELQTAEYRRWADQVKARAGHRCEWVEGGARCSRSKATGHRMIADHIVERADGGALLDPRNGQCLCTPHNTLKGVKARAARLAAPATGGGSKV